MESRKGEVGKRRPKPSTHASPSLMLLRDPYTPAAWHCCEQSVLNPPQSGVLPPDGGSRTFVLIA